MSDFVNRYPYSDAHELNLDWVIAEVRRVKGDMAGFKAANEIKFSDPIQWDITKQYEKNIIVSDIGSGRTYISMQPVPAGTIITNKDYWLMIGDFVVDINLDTDSTNPIANRPVALKINELTGSVNGLRSSLNEETTAREAADDDLSSRITNATGDISGEITAREAADALINARIDEIITPVSEDAELIDIRVGANGYTYSSAGAAVRGQIDTINDGLESSGILFIPASWTDGKYVDADGTLVTLSGASASDYIDISGYDEVIVNTDMKTGMRICVYDADQNLVRYVNPVPSSYTMTSYEVDVTGGKYIRFSSSTAGKALATVWGNVNDILKTVEENCFFSIPITGWTDNSYVDSDGSLPHFNGAAASDLIDISDVAQIDLTTWIRNGMYVCLYDAEENVISYIRSTDGSYTENTYNMDVINASYVRFSCSMSYKTSAKIEAKVKKQITALTEAVYNLDKNNHTDYVIGTNYSTLNEALTAAASVASADNVVNIYVPAGTYNVFSDIDLGDQDSGFRGLIVPDHVNIIGVGGPERVILKAELPADMTGYAFDRNSVSTLNLWRNNNLKNVTVISKNMRYPVHNDKATSDEPDYIVEHFENCIFIANGEAGVTADNIAFGSGMAKGAELHFKNCTFKSPMNPYMNTNFHNRLNGKSAVTWSFEHCNFIGGQYSMLLTSYDSKNKDLLNFIGCKMDHNIIFQTALASRQCDYKLAGCGNALTGYTWNTSDYDADAIEMML